MHMTSSSTSGSSFGNFAKTSRRTRITSTPTTDTATLHMRTKLRQPFWSRTPEASLREAIAVTTMTILLEEEQVQQAEAEAEVAEVQHRQHHLNQKATMMTCRKSSRSTATIAPFLDYNFSGSTPPH
ncbi:unnamed protein product [Closterium sp. NIES-54]